MMYYHATTKPREGERWDEGWVGERFLIKQQKVCCITENEYMFNGGDSNGHRHAPTGNFDIGKNANWVLTDLGACTL